MSNPRHRIRCVFRYRTPLLHLTIHSSRRFNGGVGKTNAIALNVIRSETTFAQNQESHLQPIEYCQAEAVDHMPCEDPRRNSQLSHSLISRSSSLPQGDSELKPGNDKKGRKIRYGTIIIIVVPTVINLFMFAGLIIYFCSEEKVMQINHQRKAFLFASLI